VRTVRAISGTGFSSREASSASYAFVRSSGVARTFAGRIDALVRRD